MSKQGYFSTDGPPVITNTNANGVIENNAKQRSIATKNQKKFSDGTHGVSCADEAVGDENYEERLREGFAMHDDNE